MDSVDSDKGWSQVNGNGINGHSSKKSVNGVTPSPVQSSGVRTPIGRFGSRDNKVAYLLFYQRMD
jgi:ubiquitin carboxyl-terminal hydrolase 10